MIVEIKYLFDKDLDEALIAKINYYLAKDKLHPIQAEVLKEKVSLFKKYKILNITKIYKTFLSCLQQEVAAYHIIKDSISGGKKFTNDDMRDAANELCDTLNEVAEYFCDVLEEQAKK